MLEEISLYFFHSYLSYDLCNLTRFTLHVLHSVSRYFSRHLMARREFNLTEEVEYSRNIYVRALSIKSKR